MLFEIIYLAIALVIGILKWQQATTVPGRVGAVVAAAIWPITFLTQELAKHKECGAASSRGGRK